MYIQQNKPLPDNFKIEETEFSVPDGSIICSAFGCNKKLSLPEQLCGDKCISHMGNFKTDPTLIIKHS